MKDSYVVFDIETTGLYPSKDKVIEIGALRVESGEVKEEFSSFINPGIRLPERIVELTGITDEMLLGAPEVNQVMEDFLSFLGEDTLMGHNVLFDYSFIKVYWSLQGKSFERKGIDTLKIAKGLHADLASRSLESLCSHYGIIQEQAHRALSDARNTFLIYKKMWEEGYETQTKLFSPYELVYRIKKEQLATEKQKKYLLDLLKYHKINYEQPVEDLTRSEASRLIDLILSGIKDLR